MVTCSQCRSVVPRGDTVFSNDGDLLCSRCGAFDAAHAQVERARVAAHAEAGQHRGALGLILGAVERAAADRQAGQMHSELVGAAYSGAAAQPLSATVPCARCQTVVARSATTLSVEGDPMCRACAASYDHVAEQKRAEGSLMLGLLMGTVLPVLGIGLAYGLKRRPAEKKGAIGGTLFVFVVLYFCWPLLLGK